MPEPLVQMNILSSIDFIETFLSYKKTSTTELQDVSDDDGDDDSRFKGISR